MEEGIEIRPGLVVGPEHLQWSFSTSGGPGGQHANRSATRADLRVDLRSALPVEVADKLIDRLGGRAKGGVVVVSADDTRSQSHNRELARERMTALLSDALLDPAPRKPTKPSRAAKERRLEAKRQRSETKKLRKPPERE